MNYLKGFMELLHSYGELMKQQKQIDIELAKLTPVINATYKALSDVEKIKVGRAIAGVRWKSKEGLKEAVLMALDAKSGEWLAPPEIRDYLETVGFNFGESGERGLASVGTTLKRMVPEEVETKVLAGGQIAYRTRAYNAKAIIDAEINELFRGRKSD